MAELCTGGGAEPTASTLRGRFELDVAIPKFKLGIEVDGFGGGHQLPKGFNRDREKDLEAACLGWQVVRVSTTQVENGMAWSYLERIITMRIDGQEGKCKT